MADIRQQDEMEKNRTHHDSGLLIRRSTIPNIWYPNPNTIPNT